VGEQDERMVVPGTEPQKSTRLSRNWEDWDDQSGSIA
jgi:hypothetical protein